MSKKGSATVKLEMPIKAEHTLENALEKARAHDQSKDAPPPITLQTRVDRAGDIERLEAELIGVLKKAMPFTNKEKCATDADANTKLGKQLKGAIDAGALDPRSAAGCRFSRHLKASAESQNQYKALPDNKARQAFRLAWTVNEYTLLESSSSYSETLNESELDEGTYEPIDVVYQREGGTQAAWARTLTYVRRATSMGGNWIKINAMTDGFEVLYIKNKRCTLFEKKWAQHQKFQVEEPELAASYTKPKALPAAALPAKRKGDTTPETPTPVKKLRDIPMDKALIAAKMTKQAFTKAGGQCTTITQAIEKDPLWAWAKTVPQYTKMLEAKDALDDIAADFSNFLIYDIKVNSAKTHEVESFTTQLDPPIKAVLGWATKLQNMHKSG
jgi:hypothetical protein